MGSRLRVTIRCGASPGAGRGVGLKRDRSMMFGMISACSPWRANTRTRKADGVTRSAARRSSHRTWRGAVLKKLSAWPPR